MSRALVRSSWQAKHRGGAGNNNSPNYSRYNTHETININVNNLVLDGVEYSAGKRVGRDVQRQLKTMLLMDSGIQAEKYSPVKSNNISINTGLNVRHPRFGLELGTQIFRKLTLK